MERFKLVAPETMERAAIAAYFNELSHEEAEVHGCLNLKRFSTNGGASYDLGTWLKEVQKARTMPNTDETVPTETFLLVREYTVNYGARNLIPNQQVVGMVSARLALNYNLFNSDGHIAVSLIQGRRRLQVEEVTLYLALNLLNKRGIEVTLMTPEISGVSEDACRDLGGKLLHQHFDDVHERELKRYVMFTNLEEYEAVYDKMILEYPQ